MSEVEEVEFEFDYAWVKRLKLADFEDWETLTGESWYDYQATAGVPVYKNNKELKDEAGNVVRRNNMRATIAFMFIVKRTEDPSWTYEQTRNLSMDALTQLYRSLNEYLEGLVADVNSKSGGTAKKRASRTQSRSNTA